MHPVDDLFKRRLTDLDKKPSDNAWLKIQQNTEAKRRGGWIWYAAASVAITVIAGYAVWQSSRNGHIISVKKHETIAALPAKDKAAKKHEKETSDSNAAKLAVNERKVSENSLSKASVKRQKAPKTDVFDKQEVVKVEVQNNVEAARSNKPIDQISSTSSVEALGLSKSESIRPVNESLASIKMTPIAAEPAITIVVAVESSDVDVEEKPKSSKLSKVFRQLKNARAGERVDWDEVGFNPKSMVARVDDRLRNKEDRGQEKDQSVKQRVNL